MQTEIDFRHEIDTKFEEIKMDFAECNAYKLGTDDIRAHFRAIIEAAHEGLALCDKVDKLN